MNDSSDALAITEHITSILLRYFRPAIKADASVVHLDVVRDRDLLRLHWSLSAEVRELANYILHHRHETQSFLKQRERSDNGPIRGRIDARATAIRRLVVGHSAITVSHEPVRSFASGPNHVLAWVLNQAWLLTGRFLAMLPGDATYQTNAEVCFVDLDRTRRIEAVRKTMGEVSLARRPSASDLKQAIRSRQKVYRLAHQAFTTLANIEAGDQSAIERVLRDTLLAPLDVWRRFELAVGLGLSQALAEVEQKPISINVLAGDTKNPIVTVGRYAIYWQSRTTHYIAPQPEPSELVVQRALSGYGMRPDMDRPDLIVVDQVKGKVVSVVEVKFFAADGEDAKDRLRDATHQVVRYSRGYRKLENIDDLLGVSVIALMRKPELPNPLRSNQPFVVDFEGIQQGNLKEWALSIPPQ